MVQLITARKRSLGKGNIFTGVCLSTGGSCPQGGLCPGGSLCPGEFQSREGLCLGVSVRETPVQLRAGGTHPTGMHSCSS